MIRNQFITVCLDCKSQSPAYVLPDVRQMKCPACQSYLPLLSKLVAWQRGELAPNK
jgi:hypothetical protein